MGKNLEGKIKELEDRLNYIDLNLIYLDNTITFNQQHFYTYVDLSTKKVSLDNYNLTKEECNKERKLLREEIRISIDKDLKEIKEYSATKDVSEDTSTRNTIAYQEPEETPVKQNTLIRFFSSLVGEIPALLIGIAIGIVIMIGVSH